MKDNSKPKKTTRKKNKDQYGDFSSGKASYGRPLQANKKKEAGAKSGSDVGRRVSSGNPAAGKGSFSNKPGAGKGLSAGKPAAGKGLSAGKPAAGKGSFSGKPAAGKDPTRKADSAKKKSRCPVSALCGGCTMIDIPYDEQIRSKQETLDDLIGDFVMPDEFIRMKAPDHYRHKVTSVFAPDRRGKPVCGIYRAGTHEVVPVKSCLLENIQADRIVQSVYSLLSDFRIRVYDEDRGAGLLRYVQIRVGRVTKEVMVTFVMTDPVLPSRNTCVRKLTAMHPEITTIVINVNDRDTTMVLGNKETVIYGKGYIEDVLCGKRFRISSRSFYQVNPLMTEKLYNIAIDCAALSGKETILDTYCGIGTIGIIAAPHARRVIGVELNAEAVRDAGHNIRMNCLQNVEIVQGDATRFMTEIAQSGTFESMSGEGREQVIETTAPVEKIDVIFMDPPRSGSTEEFMTAACSVNPKKIVYISCSPWSLQRDLEFFEQNGYRAKKAVPVDMFPYTSGIETVVLLTHN